MDLPPLYEEPDLRVLDAHDTIPSNIDPSTISYLSEFLSAPLAFFTPNLCTTARSPDNGEGVSIDSTEVSSSHMDYEWTTVETVLIRYRADFVTNGTFPVHSINTWGWEIGYDAAVCVQKYEPWIIEAYNASFASPSILRIVEKENSGTSSPSGKIQGIPIASTRHLNTSIKHRAFDIAHGNGIHQMMKVNYRDTQYYLPSPTVSPAVPPCAAFLLTPTYSQAISFTEGDVADGYTELSPERFGIIRARVGAANALPYLVGSGPLVAQSYADETLAYTTFKQWQLIGFPILVWVLGMIGELFVPTLPFDLPRRGFDVYSWLALFHFRVRGLGRVPCIRAKRPSTFRNCGLRRLTRSKSS